MDRNKLVSLVSLVVYFVGSMPSRGVCAECLLGRNGLVKNVFHCVKAGTRETVSYKIKGFEASFESVPDSFEGGRKLIQLVVDELNSCYGMQFTITDACIIVRDNLERLQLSQELQADLLIALDFYEPKTPATNPLISQEISGGTHTSTNELYIHVPWVWNFFGLHESEQLQIKSRPIATTVASAATELELPDKMAVGFACVLAGALICIIPGGQAVGVWMIATGTTLALDGFSGGEFPYYKNTDTGEIISIKKSEWAKE